MSFFLRFTLISYASIFFFTIGLGLALSRHFDLKFYKLLIIFAAISIPLLFVFQAEPFQGRLLISGVWTSVIAIGHRFGEKMNRHTHD